MLATRSGWVNINQAGILAENRSRYSQANDPLERGDSVVSSVQRNTVALRGWPVMQQLVLSCISLPPWQYGPNTTRTVQLARSFRWSTMTVIQASAFSLSRFQGHTEPHQPHSVGLLWTSDQPDAETSTWQHTTITRDIHPCPWRDSNPKSQQASGHRQTP
jgi:hypothetical protein